jgi:aspartyl/glutamyl-tRNA(Asn/Gln) amidotransferase, C subunit
MNSAAKTPEINVARICELAHLDMSADEMALFQGQLENILGYVEKLGELDLSGIEPTVYGQPVVNVFRDDAAEPWLAQEQAIDNAPEKIGGEFRVPKIVE